MKFFIPLAKDKEQRDRVYKSIREFVSQEYGEITDRKIYRIDFRHDGEPYKAIVGEETSFNNELVIAILESKSVFLVCTPNRGVKRGGPILIGKNYSTKPTDFNE